MSKADSGIKYLFAGLLTVVGIILIALFWQPFYLWVRFHAPETVTIEDVARDRLPEGALVRVEGVRDPRHVFIAKEPGGERLLEISLLLADDSYMTQWRDAIERDVGLFRSHLEPALKGELRERNLKEWMETLDNYDHRWNNSTTQLNKTIRDAWPGYAVGLSRVCDNWSEIGFERRAHSERNWVLRGFEPPGGPPERPVWPDEIVLSNPIRASEIPMLRGYLQGEADYFEGAAAQVAAELEAFDPDSSFGRLTTVVGTVRKMPTDAYEAYEAIDDLSFDVYFYIKEGDALSTIGLVFVPIGCLIVMIMLGLMMKWALSGRSRYDFDD